MSLIDKWLNIFCGQGELAPAELDHWMGAYDVFMISNSIIFFSMSFIVSEDDRKKIAAAGGMQAKTGHIFKLCFLFIPWENPSHSGCICCQKVACLAHDCICCYFGAKKTVHRTKRGWSRRMNKTMFFFSISIFVNLLLIFNVCSFLFGSILRKESSSKLNHDRKT